MTQVLEHLPGKREALSSKPSATKNKMRSKVLDSCFSDTDFTDLSDTLLALIRAL
jgi:hypothetical protein